MITSAQIKAIEAVLAGGDRVELIPVKDGVKIIHIRRREIKEEKNRCLPQNKSLHS